MLLLVGSIFFVDFGFVCIIFVVYLWLYNIIDLSLILPKLTLLYCLVLIILLQFFGKVGVFVSFKINQKYIASNICEKKDIPQNTCEGGCFLKKELQKEDQKAEKTKNNNQNFSDFYISNNIFIENKKAFFSIEKHFFKEKNNNFPLKNTNKLLRPPQVV